VIELLAAALLQSSNVPAYAEWAAHSRCVTRAAGMMAQTNESIAEAGRLTVNLCAPYLSAYELALFETGIDETSALRRSEAVARDSLAEAERIITRIRLCGTSEDCEALFTPEPLSALRPDAPR